MLSLKIISQKKAQQRDYIYFGKQCLQNRECVFLSFSSFMSSYLRLDLLYHNLSWTTTSVFRILLQGMPDFPLYGSTGHLLLLIPPPMASQRPYFSGEMLAHDSSMASTAGTMTQNAFLVSFCTTTNTTSRTV